MSPEEAQRRFYEHYAKHMHAMIHGDTSKPLVQGELSRRSWASIIADIEADVDRRYAFRMLEQIERDANADHPRSAERGVSREEAVQHVRKGEARGEEPGAGA